MVKRLVAFVVIGVLAGVVVGIVVSTVGSTGAKIHQAIATGRRLLHPNARSLARHAVHTATTTVPHRSRTMHKTSTSTTATAKTTTTTGTGTATTPALVATGPATRCDQNIAAHGAGGPAAACVLAENAFYEVYRGARASNRVPAQIRAWDPAAGAYVAMRCSDHGARVTCLGADGRASTFPLLAVREYTPALARRFTSGRNLGPNG